MSRSRYFTPGEVSVHNSAADLWVSFLGKVCNLTLLVEEHMGDILLMPIVECAGKDISHWFDPQTKDVLTHVDPVTNCVRYFTPRGRFVHVPPPGPRSDWDTDVGRPWWRNRDYEVGLLTAKVRWLRVVNTLTSQEQLLEVCSEETLEEVARRYSRYNTHTAGYTWKHGGGLLAMDRTLPENGLPDQDPELDLCRLDRDLFTPALTLHFNDDLTEL
ncbi:hypothetical protein NHX12_013896 [Muraenolepis orangiensis]|uniref:Cytochrome b5 domain-containing protein 1 n=1 Tax=Muraenolepis orangiensis TaxID=630683 RepID=A0A9Q0I4P6_9TELE|nr:hypothetical protein NHX12_013896 [Muraenolepis orangiensis]